MTQTKASPPKNLGAIVLSRMDSSRLPGKALKEVAGHPMIWYVLERAKRIVGINSVVLATTDRNVDTPLAETVSGWGVPVFRGSCNDVAGRVLNCALHFEFDAFVRVCGDSPLLDWEALSAGVTILKDQRMDIVTNRIPRSFPIGQSVEILRTDIFEQGYGRMSTDDHYEHVTAYFYEHLDTYTMHNMLCPSGNHAALSVAVDTAEDLERFRAIAQSPGVDPVLLSGADAIAMTLALTEKMEANQ